MYCHQTTQQLTVKLGVECNKYVFKYEVYDQSKTIPQTKSNQTIQLILIACNWEYNDLYFTKQFLLFFMLFNKAFHYCSFTLHISYEYKTRNIKRVLLLDFSHEVVDFCGTWWWSKKKEIINCILIVIKALELVVNCKCNIKCC